MKAHLLALVAAFAAVSATHAAVLVSFDMSTIVGTGSSKGIGVTSFDSGLTSTDLLKNNLTSASPTNAITNYGVGTKVSVWTTNSAQPTIDVATTLANANYITFTVAPVAGNTITLESISFQAAASSNSTPRSIYLLSSVTGFTSDAVLLSAANAAGGGTLPLRSGGVLGSYTYTFIQPGAVDISTPTEFRIYLQTGAAGQDIDFDNIVLNGTVAAAIPEPSSFAMLSAAGALGLAACRRRR
jgi:hypothetical protein